MEIQKPNSDRHVVGALFDEQLPYQVIMLTLATPNNRAEEVQKAFDHILKTIKIDYSLRGMVGNQSFVISEKCQEFFVVTEISNPSAEKVVFVVQEPHWDWRGQWNLHQGLRVLFSDNPNLLTTSAFLSEGVRAMEQISIDALLQAEPSPEPRLTQAILESFLVTGYLTFNWMTNSQIPVFGTEDWPLYQESIQLWGSDKRAPWAVTVAARNEKMVEVMAQMQSRFENPMLFVGGMHMHSVSNDLFAEGHIALDADSPSLRKSNLGIKDWLKQKGFDYIYIEPLPDVSLQEDLKLTARYRELFTAQMNARYDGYIERFVSGYQSRFAAGDYKDGVTVTPNPAEAARIVTALKKDLDGDDDSGTDTNKRSGLTRSTVDRYNDAVSKVNLAGLGIQKGRKRIKDADPNLKESVNIRGRHEWRDKKGVLRVAYDPRGEHMKAHWDKRAPSGEIRLDNAGRPVRKHYDGSVNHSQHIWAE